MTQNYDSPRFSHFELSLIREWYDAVKDVTPNYLEKDDHELAYRIYVALGMRPSHRLADDAGLPRQEPLQT